MIVCYIIVYYIILVIIMYYTRYSSRARLAPGRSRRTSRCQCSNPAALPVSYHSGFPHTKNAAVMYNG